MNGTAAAFATLAVKRTVASAICILNVTRGVGTRRIVEKFGVVVVRRLIS